MQTYSLSQLTEETLNELVTLHETDGALEVWAKMRVALTSEERVHLGYITSDVHLRHRTIMNEATIWGRAIYPLLRLAEQNRIVAWAGVPLKATYPTFELEGEADGALAPSVGGRIEPPYLIVHEAKRGVNAPNPQFQLYGEMLAAAWLNWKKTLRQNKRFLAATLSQMIGPLCVDLCRKLRLKDLHSTLNFLRDTTVFLRQNVSFRF